MDSESLLIDALAQLGIEARHNSGVPGLVGDLIFDVGGVHSAIRLEYRALVSDDVARRLLAQAETADDAVLVLVGDRVTEAARKELIANRGGYLDLRGRLALRARGVLIDAEVEPVRGRAQRSDALSGKAGLETATAILMRPQQRIAVRQLAREVGRSPSTVSDILTAMRRDGLIDESNMVIGTDLFWQVADRWPHKREYLAAMPDPYDSALAGPLRLGLEDTAQGPGWALTDSLAAMAYGAGVAVRSDHAADFLVPDEATARRALNLLGPAASSSQARATVRVAPVPAAVLQRDTTDGSLWPLAHPLFVALDLAQDYGRGREILDAWTPEGYSRVW